MPEQESPFILKHGETIIRDASSIEYYGVAIQSTGFIGGGMFGGLFGGITSSTQKTLQKSIYNAESCHVYLTNRRLVFVKAKRNILTHKETKIENIFSEIPLELIGGVYEGKKLYQPTVDLSVKSPSGEINTIAFAFLQVGFRAVLNRPTLGGGIDMSGRVTARDEWIKLIINCKSNLLKDVSRGNSEEPIEILKLRYAKGEITKEEYDQMKTTLTE